MEVQDPMFAIMRRQRAMAATESGVRKRKHVMDVMSFREGCLRAMPCLVVTALLWTFGGLFVIYEMILLNSQDIDTRDILNDFRSTIGPIQRRHDALFPPAFWPRVAGNVTALTVSSEVVLPSADIATVNLVTGNLTCPVVSTEDIACLSATVSAASLIQGRGSDYASCHDFAAAHPGSTSALTSPSTTNLAGVTAALVGMQNAPPGVAPSLWNASAWESVACANWDAMRSLQCAGILRDPCVESYELMESLANNNNDGRNAFSARAPRVRFVQLVVNATVPVSLQLASWFGMAATDDVAVLSNGTAIADSLSRARNITQFAEASSALMTTEVGGGFVPPRVGLKQAVRINGDTLELFSTSTQVYERHKSFGWQPPFWVHKSPCPYVQQCASPRVVPHTGTLHFVCAHARVCVHVCMS